MTSRTRRERAPATLTKDQLAEVSGGATEELFGTYNFLLEVSGVTPDQRAANGFKPPIGSDKGS